MGAQMLKVTVADRHVAQRAILAEEHPEPGRRVRRRPGATVDRERVRARLAVYRPWRDNGSANVPVRG